MLRKGEALSTFIEDSLIKQAQWRKEDAEFYARGQAAAAKARQIRRSQYAVEFTPEAR